MSARLMLWGVIALVCSQVVLAADKPKDLVEIRGQVVDEQGRPAIGINVTLISDVLQRSSICSGLEGNFSLHVERERLYNPKLVARSDDGLRQGCVMYGYGEANQSPKKVDATHYEVAPIVLAPPREVPVSVVDAEGRPVADALAVVTHSNLKLDSARTDKQGQATLLVPASAQLRHLYALHEKAGLDYRVYRRPGDGKQPGMLEGDHQERVKLELRGTRPLEITVVDHKGAPVPNSVVSPHILELPDRGGSLGVEWGLRLTDDKGIVKYPGFPRSNYASILVFKRGYFAPKLTQIFGSADPDTLTVKLLSQGMLRGSVKHADGRPAAGAQVQINGDGDHVNGFRSIVLCDDSGAFEQQINPDEFYVIAARLEKAASPPETRVIRVGEKIEPVELTLKPTTRIFGTLVDSAGNALPRQQVSLYFHGDEKYINLPVEARLERPEGATKSIDPKLNISGVTNADGFFEIFAPPGEYELFAQSINNTTEVGVKRPKVIVGQEELELNLKGK